VRRLLVQKEDRVMSRRCVALTILVLAGTALVLPEASARSFGFSGGARVGGFRAPFAARPNTRVGPSHRVPGAYAAILQRPFIGPASRPAAHFAAHELGRNIAPDLRSRFVRRHHRGSIGGERKHDQYGKAKQAKPNAHVILLRNSSLRISTSRILVKAKRLAQSGEVNQGVRVCCPAAKRR